MFSVRPSAVPAPCPDVNGGTMRRAILVALGIGAVVTSAAAFSIGGGEESAGITREQFA